MLIYEVDFAQVWSNSRFFPLAQHGGGTEKGLQAKPQELWASHQTLGGYWLFLQSSHITESLSSCQNLKCSKTRKAWVRGT